MRVLGIDGALGAFSTALVCDGRIEATALRPGNVALETGLQLVAELLEGTRAARGEIDRIAVGAGPGGFTGLRIAIAYAKSLAQAWRLPLVAVSSFELLEFGRDLPVALSVVVGRPGVISARYRASNRTRRASGRTDEVLAELAIEPSAPALPVVGAPKDVLAALAERAITVTPLEPMVMPPAAAAALAGASREPAPSVHDVRPDYGELPAAKIPKNR